MAGRSSASPEPQEPPGTLGSDGISNLGLRDHSSSRQLTPPCHPLFAAQGPGKADAGPHARGARWRQERSR